MPLLGGGQVVQISTLQLILTFVGVMATVLVLIVGVVNWSVKQTTGLHGRQEGHEHVCEERYRQIAANFAQLVKVSDERHEENRERLDELREDGRRVETKLDRLIEARRT